MGTSAAARKRLKAYWLQAIAAEGIVLCARMLPIITGLAYTCTAHHFGTSWTESAAGHIVPVCAMLLLDWLTVSPLLLGRTMLYWDIISHRQVSCTRVFDGFGIYGKALRWRAGRFFRRVIWSAVCYAPTVAVIRIMSVWRTAPPSPYIDSLLLTGMVGLLILPLAGFVVCESAMFRYAAADCLIAAGNGCLSCRGIFSRSCKSMCKHTGGMVWLSLRFAGWGLASLLILPGIYAAPLYHTSRLMTVRHFVLEGA